MVGRQIEEYLDQEACCSLCGKRRRHKDHCLFLHPDQLALIENNLPANTVGSLAAKIKVECLIFTIEGIIKSGEPTNQFKKFAAQLLEHAAVLLPSKKHLVGKTIGKLAPTPSLKYRNAPA